MTPVEFRRHLHRHPELSWQEVRTTGVVEAELAALGIPTRRFDGHTGVMGTLRGTGGAGGKTLLLRADIDALPILEQTGLPFASENEGVMHACGHDTHTAMLLGAARILSSLRDQFAGEVRFLFQGAEEINDGAGYCIAQGVLDGVVVVGLDPDQQVAVAARLGEIAHVPGMEEIEDAVGEDDTPAGRPLFGDQSNRLVAGEDRAHLQAVSRATVSSPA